MAILFAGDSHNLTVSDNTFNQSEATITAIYFGKASKKIVAERNQINVPKGNNQNYLIIDHSKNLKRSSTNQVLEKF